jgi:nitrous oxidase accessory protein
LGEEVRKASAVLLSVLLACLVTLSFDIRPAKAGTITVPDDYLTIQEAISHAIDGDIVFVRNGTYYENVVVNKTLSLVGENREGTIIDGNRMGVVVTVLANDTSLAGFTIRNASQTLEECTVLRVVNASGFELSQSILEFEWSCEGIQVLSSEKATLTDNTLIGQSWSDTGIIIGGSNNCIVSRNSISSGWPILLLTLSCNNTITDNFLFSKGYEGIRLSFSSTYNNLICGNSIFNASWYGLRARYGSSNNLIFHNNFINNTVQAECSPLCFNSWDNGCEGNYWSDYNGSDSDSDGIGDTPYVINENNTDPYPLMNPYWNIGDINHDLKVDIFDIASAAGAYGSTPSSPNWNPHCDINEPYGVINIFDVLIIAINYGEAYTP